MRKSIITITLKWTWTDKDGNKHKRQRKEFSIMLIPNLIGNILRGFSTIINKIRELPLGHRRRGDIDIELI